MDGYAWAAISALATALSGVVTAAFRYLIAENRELKSQIKRANDSLLAGQETNSALAGMVPGLMAEVQELRAKVTQRG